jgi:hypothetical protein
VRPTIRPARKSSSAACAFISTRPSGADRFAYLCIHTPVVCVAEGHPAPSGAPEEQTTEINVSSSPHATVFSPVTTRNAGAAVPASPFGPGTHWGRRAKLAREDPPVRRGRPGLPAWRQRVFRARSHTRRSTAHRHQCRQAAGAGETAAALTRGYGWLARTCSPGRRYRSRTRLSWPSPPDNSSRPAPRNAGLLFDPMPTDMTGRTYSAA